jgi:hypothetical protein
VRVDARGKPTEAVYAQHCGAERCGWPAVRTRDSAPVAFLANGSHAAYSAPACGTGPFRIPMTRREATGASSARPSW